MPQFTRFSSSLSNWIWSYPLLILLVSVGLFYTYLLRGLQLRYLFYSIKLIFVRHDNEAAGDVSQFQALMTSMSATIGIGSITGVATAIAAGGLGALFWMWVIGLIGLATKYGEAILGIKYRIHDESGQMSGGPMYYLERGLEWKKWAVLFSVAGAVAALTTGNMVQSNSVAEALTGYFTFDKLWIGVVLALLTAFVLIRGIKSISWVTQVLVPLMALLYIVGGLIIIGVHYRLILPSFAQIFYAAFHKQAAFGGFLGSSVMMAIRMGVARGIFSNEAGLGSSPIAAAAAKTDRPGRQAMISMSGAFIATFIICTITGLVIATGNALGQTGPDGVVLDGSKMVIFCFDQALSGSGWIVSLALIMFGYTTILGWAYYGEKCFEFLFGQTSVVLYRVLYVLFVVLGSVIGMDLIWSLSDLSNAFMAFPNLLGLLGLAFAVRKESDSFLKVVKKEQRAL